MKNRPEKKEIIEYKRKFMNPVGTDNMTKVCNFCNSTFHFRRNCPELAKLEKRVKDGQEVDKGKSNNFSYFADCTNNYNIDSRMRKYDETDFQEPNIFDVKFSYFVGCMRDDTNDKMGSLVSESYGYAILDCGCPNTVCGQQWMDNYIRSLCDDDRVRVTWSSSKQTFTFGIGKTITSIRKMTIPVWINGVKGELTTDVVDCNIPLLLSLNVMKKADMVLIFKHDIVQLHGGYVNLKLTTSGHYAIPLSL